MQILVLHGINLDMFGKRDSEHYGTITLDEINQSLGVLANELGIALDHFQSNHEGEFCERIHRAVIGEVDAVLVNAGAWTHYSYGIRDAFAMLAVPVIELHMSHVHARENFRRHSVLSDVVAGQISGFGVNSYLLGLRAAHAMLGSAR